MKCLRPSMKRDSLRVVLPIALLGSCAAGAQDINWALVDEYCTECHNTDDFAGSTALDLMPRDALAENADTWEMVLRKVRTGMMPPAGKPRPPRAALDAFTHSLGAALDVEYSRAPNPGSEGLARLNREEYRNAIRDM